MSLKRKNLGILGEQLAKKLLLNKGYRFLQQNFRCRLGEIDLIFQDKNTLVFVEVKTRYAEELSLPEEAITPPKLKTISRVIDYFYLRYPALPKLARIDVVAIQLEQGTLKLASLKHFSNVTG